MTVREFGDYVERFRTRTRAQEYTDHHRRGGICPCRGCSEYLAWGDQSRLTRSELDAEQEAAACGLIERSGPWDGAR